MSEYLSEFVQESKESITELNNALLDLERSPDDGDAMDRVFRTAHTLKGNAGAMGLDEASDLAHAMEDLLDAIRAGSLEVTPELMDEVFGGVDDLERMVEEVESHGDIRTDPSDRIESLRSWVEESTGLVKPTDDEIATTLDGLDRQPRRQHRVFHARLSLADEAGGGPVVDALRDAFDLLATDPGESRIRDGDYHGWVDVAFGSAVDEAAIAAALDPVDAVEDAIITDVPDETVEAAIEADSPSDLDADADPEVDPDDMSVDQLLGEFEEYDDLDEAVDRVEDIQGLDMDDLGEAGAFDDVVEEDVETTAGDEPQEASTPDDAEEEVEDPMAEFESLQEEYDRVGLDEMESELEDVSFGEYDTDDEVGFDELIGEETEPAEPEPAEAEPAEPEPAEADTEPITVEAPDDATVESVLDAAADPTDPDQEVYHVRLAITEDEGGNNGQRVIEALRDAFDLLGTAPPEDEVSLGEYGDSIDAVFGAEVATPEIASALDPVEEVGDVAITTVTDRVTFPEPEPEPEPTEDVDVAPEILEAEGEIQNAHSEFQQMQEAFDQVGLDEIESELEGVEFGEYDETEEVGFDELLGEAETAEADAADPEVIDRPSVEAPDEDAVAEAIEAAAAPTDRDNEVFHVRLGIVETEDTNNGIRVVEALHDAFDVLGTVPPEEGIEAGEHDAYVDAVFASHVGEGEIESALDPVEEVSDAAITPVTDRVSFPEPEPDTGVEADAEGDTAAAAGDEEVEDPMAEFETLQDEYDRVGIEEMESELEGVSFGEYDAEDEVGFDELIGEETEPAEADADAEPEPASATGTEAGQFGEASDEDFAEAETGDGAFGEVEAGGEDFGEVEAGGEDFGEVEAGDEDFGEVDVGSDDFGEADASADDFGDTGVGADEFGEASTDDFGTDEEIDEVEVGEITVEDDSIDTEFGVDVGDEESVPETDESFGEVEVGETDDFGDVGVGETDDFGDVGDAEPTPDLPEEAQADVDTIKGIGSGYADRLAEAAVETVGDLVTADPGDLSATTDISESRIDEWVDRAPVAPADLEADAEAEPEPETAEPEAEPEPEPDPESEVEEIQSIRVDVDRVDELLNLVEGLVTTRARLRRAVEEGADPDTLLDEIDELDVISDEMQDNVVEMRLVPVRTVTQRLPRIVRDIARDQGKRVRFDVEGEDVEIDRSILNRIGDPLMHLVRNAVDHGIEPPEEREARGKDREGRVTLSVRRQRDDAIIEVSDDGRGLDPDDLREKAVEEGLLHEDAAEALDDDDAYDLIFESGFSTTEEVTDVSGRGVGMDVVASVVEDLDGAVDVESDPGEGTTIRMRLPVSVAISEVVFLQVGDEEYGVPIKVVDEIGGMRQAERLEADGGERIRTADGAERELIELHDELDVPGQAVTNGGGMLVTIEDDVRSAAIHCDRVRGQQEVVVKPFDGLLSDIPGLSGAAVLGEGEVVNIVDVETL